MPQFVLLVLLAALGLSPAAYATPQDCLDPDQVIRLEGQIEVNNWTTNYGCTSVQGKLFIQDASASAVTDLTPLSTLTNIDNTLLLGSGIGLSALTSLSGLENITSVGRLNIVKMPLLSDISALSNLSTLSCSLSVSTGCESALFIQDAPQLTDISALSNIKTATPEINSLVLENVGVTTGNLSQLLNLPQGVVRVTLSNLSQITSATHGAELNYLAAKTGVLQLEALPNVTAVPIAPALVTLTIDNTPVADFTTLNSASSLGNLNIQKTPTISDTDFGFIASLPTAAGLSLNLANMSGLVNLSGLNGVTSLRRLTLTDNPSLVNLSGLSTLTTIIDFLSITGNSALVSLDGLDGLRDTTSNNSFAGKVEIGQNPTLNNVRALRGIADAAKLFVYSNTSLNECDVFHPIVVPPAETYFSGNGSSCNGFANTSDIPYTPPTLTIAPGALDFASVNVGSSQTNTLTLTAAGSPSTQVVLGNLQIIDTNAWFSIDSSPQTTCALGDVLNSGENCVVSITVNPQAAGPDQADLRVPYVPSYPIGGLLAPSHAALTVVGNGQASANLAPNTTLNFGSETIGSASTPQTVTVSNSGTAALTISSISDDDPADFPITDNCGGTVAIGATCDITVTFTPTRRGAVSGTLTLSSSATQPTQRLVLTGTGTAPPALVINPSSFTFGATATGTLMTQSATITNNGDDDLVVGQSTFSNQDFSFNTDSCSGQTLAANQSCNVIVAFAPSSVASVSGSLSIASNDPSAPTVASLSGTGEAPAALVVTPANLDFGEVALGSTKNLTLTLSNNGGGTTDIAISSVIPLTTDYSLPADNCSGQSLAGGASCTVTVRFSPNASGPDNTDLTISHSLSASSPTTVGLIGTGGTPVAYITPSSIDFGDVAVNTLSSATVVTVGDSSASNLVIARIESDDPEFRIFEDTCSGQTVNGGNQCTFKVATLPTALGGISGTISVVSDSASSPDRVSLLVNSVSAAAVQVSSPVLTFSDVSVGTNAAQTVSISNAGGFDLILGQLVLTGASAFTATSDSCSGQTIATGQSCSVSIEYSRASNAESAGELSIPSNSAQSPNRVLLRAPQVIATPVPALSGTLLLLLSFIVVVLGGATMRRGQR